MSCHTSCTGIGDDFPTGLVKAVAGLEQGAKGDGGDRISRLQKIWGQ